MTLTEALAEKASRGEMSPAEVQSALALLLHDLVERGGPGGAVSGSQDDVPTRRNLRRSPP